jgi:predicted transcriptional regulator
MKTNISAAFAAYEPVHYKTFQGAMEAFFEQECPQIGGFRTRQTLVNFIYSMVMKFFPETNHLRPGQTVWATVHKNEKGSYGKTIKNTALTPVVLTLVQATDALDRAHGKHLREIKKEATARLCQQAFEQDGCLTGTEIAVLLKMSQQTVGRYLREYELEHKTVLPRRGTIHDMGPTLTHKKLIIEKLFLQQKTVQQTMRETCHSARAIERYITSFKQILLCYRKAMNIDEIAYSVRKTKNLVQEYLDIIEEYKERSYILDEMVNYEVKIETAFERNIRAMAN